MTADPSIDPARFLAEHLERAEPDLPRSMLKTFIDALMGAEADALCGAPYGARRGERVNSRNGYRSRDRGGTPARAPWRSRSPGCGRVVPALDAQQSSHGTARHSNVVKEGVVAQSPAPPQIRPCEAVAKSRDYASLQVRTMSDTV